MLVLPLLFFFAVALCLVAIGYFYQSDLFLGTGGFSFLFVGFSILATGVSMIGGVSSITIGASVVESYSAINQFDNFINGIGLVSALLGLYLVMYFVRRKIVFGEATV